MSWLPSPVRISSEAEEMTKSGEYLLVMVIQSYIDPPEAEEMTKGRKYLLVMVIQSRIHTPGSRRNDER